MRKLFYHSWWKILGIVIMLYVLSVGFLVPLKPGVLSVEPSRLVSGESIKIHVFAYNSNFDKSGRSLSAYIKIDSTHTIQASSVDIVNRKELDLVFDMPSQLPSLSEDFQRGTLIIADSQDGFLVTPSAFTIAKSEQEFNGEITTWDANISSIDSEWRFAFPFRGILYETIRNTFFHVAIWFAMFLLLFVGLVYSIRYLNSRSLDHDAVAASFTHVAVVFGLIGVATGSVWAKNSWGVYWTNDPKLNMSVVSLMIYIAYSILRSSIEGDDRRAQISAAYNIFAFVAMIPLIFIIPRMTSSLHPGNGGNPALGGEDLDNTLRMVFYPAIIGLTLIGMWVSTLLYRIRRIQLNIIDHSLKDD